MVRELLSGSTRFNEIRCGVPRMSPALPSTRLTHLTKTGIVERRVNGREVEYMLTAAGRELAPVVEAVEMWGVRWAGKPTEVDYDPKLLMWDMHRNVNHAAVPHGRTVVHFRFPELRDKGALWWMILTPTDADADADADVCEYDPGHAVGVTVNASLRVLTVVWLGQITWRAAQRDGAVEITGPTSLHRALPSWFPLSGAAAVPRPRADLFAPGPAVLVPAQRSGRRSAPGGRSG